MKRVDLEKNWTLSCPDLGIKLENIHVPSSVFVELINAGKLPDPFVGGNEQESKWVFEHDWTYRLEFTASPDFQTYDCVQLVFEGIDTIATITLNGSVLCHTENMHRQYSFTMGSKLQASNVLEVTIHSPTQRARAEIDKRGRLPSVVALPGVAYLRKAQYSFGWDWGPQLPDMGLWKTVYLTGFKVARFDEVNITQDHLEGTVTLGVSVSIERLVLFQKLRVKAILREPTGRVIEQATRVSDQSARFNYEIKDPSLWWTHDYGPQPLYEVSVLLLHDEGGTEVLVDARSIRIGLRVVKLVRREDAWGETFYLELNGVPLFAKGGNWIPADSFLPRVTPERIRGLLESFRAAHMNLIRVWGGGIYETDVFYEICDTLGFLVWQDFPFACSPYPYYPEFFENIQVEAIQNIQRLRDHPSLALWCGNNECEEGWVYWKWDEGPGKRNPELKSGYLRLFEELLPALVHEHDPGRPYWPSSPSSGGGFEEPKAENRGDAHYWDVWHGRKPFADYRNHFHRFQSEFGFEAFPSMKTICAFHPSGSPEEEFDILSQVMLNHQKCPGGNITIMYYMEDLFAVPDAFDAIIYFSQLTQAEAIKYGVEHWRRHRTNQHCMGALYWQLNDCWPVASWASIDYFGRWKALHYHAQHFFAPILLSLEENAEEFSVKFWVTNDLMTEFKGRLHWNLVSSSGEIVDEGALNITVPALTASEVAAKKFSENSKVTRTNVILFAYLEEASGQLVGRNQVLFCKPKNLGAENPEIQVKILEGNQIEVATKKPALWVRLEHPENDVVFSDNYFFLHPRESRLISITRGLPDGILLTAKDIRVTHYFAEKGK